MPTRIAGPCPISGCPNRSGSCPKHKPTTTSRDYGSGHQAERRRWQSLIDLGGIACRRCQALIPPRQPASWDLGHPAPKAPECRACNRATMGRDRH